MKTLFSYLRLIVASSMFVGGLVLAFGPSPMEAQRELRWRDNEWHNLRDRDRREQERMRDEEQARVETALRTIGILLGGLGLAIALHEAAFVLSRFIRTGE